jgi:hypothetical protein
LLLIPHDSAPPALTELNVPAGGTVRPSVPGSPSKPQQETPPSVLTPQVWL